MMEIRAEHLTKSYEGRPVLRDVTFTAGAGITRIAGRSGAGKTTLLRILLGLETAESGRVLVPDGCRWAAVFQEDRLLMAKSAGGNLRFALGGAYDVARAAALLPARADTVSLYRRIRGGHVAAADLQPVFAAEGPQNTGKTLASLTALQELGLIEEQEGRWLPVPVTAKQDLASAPVLQKLAELAKQA